MTDFINRNTGVANLELKEDGHAKWKARLITD